jgi:hypothetical protein
MSAGGICIRTLLYNQPTTKTSTTWARSAILRNHSTLQDKHQPTPKNKQQECGLQ